MDEEEEKEPSSQKTRMADPSYQSSAQGRIIGFPGAVYLSLIPVTYGFNWAQSLRQANPQTGPNRKTPPATRI